MEQITIDVVDPSKYTREQLWHFLRPIESYYPRSWEWFKRVYPEIESFDRPLFMAIEDSQIVGVAIVKDIPKEQKICTLLVKEGFRRQGIGSKLLRLIIDIHRIETPYITIPEEELSTYSTFLAKYSFFLEESIFEKYRPNKTDYIFRRIPIDIV